MEVIGPQWEKIKVGGAGLLGSSAADQLSNKDQAAQISLRASTDSNIAAPSTVHQSRPSLPGGSRALIKPLGERPCLSDAKTTWMIHRPGKVQR
ncbi:hypothetical protein PGTUg99_011539 [Puccinia graminis f. sp. tritici]|uniref:Uncharacterized protein n=1 Tax=Puccinia graminis f. sp. tritici TaxID=56615 RepID=A0A5B0QKL2_PUCGR|nr:hypothetical protein PGTUg99_011539 [Puccinia graminis f. sp. tritici]